MAGFDKNRFVEAFAAALLGAYINDRLKGANSSGGSPQDAAQKFQRCLLLASSHDAFTETVSLRCKQRIGLLTEAARLRYIRLTLQPNQAHCDERLTTLMIFDHALQPNAEWEATLRILGVNNPDARENAEQAISGVASGFENGLKYLDESLKERVERRERERENKRSKPWYKVLRFLTAPLRAFFYIFSLKWL